MLFPCTSGGNFAFFLKKTMRPFFLLCFCSCFGFLFGQDFTPKYEHFHGNNLRFSVSSDGRLFHDTEGGGDLRLSYKEEGRAYASSLHFAGLWLGGLDPSGNLHTSVHLEDDENNGFQPGIVFSHLEGAPVDSVLEGTNSVWRVTRAEILKHQRDYADNGRIDDPQPAIYAWPGARNPHYGAYNNTTAELPTEVSGLAPYWDHDADGIYNPDEGDYPIASNRFDCWRSTIPDVFFWLSFNNLNNNSGPLNTNKHPIQVNLTGAVYYCGKRSFSNAEHSAMSHALFLEYSVHNKGFVPLDSLYFGMFMDAAPDCGPGRHLGTKPDQELLYFYNTEGASTADCRFTDLVGCKVLTPPWNSGQGTTGNDTIFTVRFKKMSQLFPLGESPVNGQRFPGQPLEVYRYLNADWADGTSISYGGSGYGSLGAPTDAIFSGFPTDEFGWSEAALGHTPGRRMGLMSAGPIGSYSGRVHFFQVAFPLSRWSYEGYNQDERLNLFFADAQHLTYWGDCYPPVDQGCVQEDLTPPEPEEPPVEPALFLWPNPTRSIVTLNARGIPIYWYRIYNTKGQLMYANDAPDEVEQVPVSGWQTGVYFVQAGWGGEVVTRKLLVR